VAEAVTLSAQLNLVLRGTGSAILPLSAARQMALRETIRIIPIRVLLTYRAVLLNRKTANPIAMHAVAQEFRDIFWLQNWSKRSHCSRRSTTAKHPRSTSGVD